MPKKSKVQDISSFVIPSNINALGPSPSDIEDALKLKDPVERAYRIQQMIDTWKKEGADHGFASDKEFIQFLEDNSKSCAAHLMVCLRETIRIIQDRLASPNEIKTNELTALLSELGRQLKAIQAQSVSNTPKTEQDLDEELEQLKKEIGEDLDGI